MADAATVVEEYLRLHMIPDPDAARRYCAPEIEIRFTGNRLMRDPAEATAFNRARYKWVKKKFGWLEVWNDSAEWLLVRAGLARP